MFNRLEIHSTWNALVQAWKSVWQASHEIERWAAFMPHCDHLLALSRQHDLHELEAAILPVIAVLDNIEVPSEDLKGQIDRMLFKVFSEVRDVCADSSRRQVTRAAEPDTLPLVVMLTLDGDSVRELLLQMEHYGYAFRVFSDFRLGLQAAVNERAAAVVVDIGAGFTAPVIEQLDELNRAGLKWFALSTNGDFAIRLQAVRHGALAYFLAPLAISPLVDALDPLAYTSSEEPYRVLILDDSLTVLASIQKTLEQFSNINVRTLRQPNLILDNLLDFSPDVLILDFHMQGCTGLEVAKIIRQNKAFESIPIVYLTSETSEAVQLEAMRHGGDDFLTKPISQAQLVNTVISKAERYRGLRKLMVEDSLTGLYNHVKTKALLQQSLLLAERQGFPVSYAILDIDHFKRVNDNYGHSMGDKVLKTLARFLKQRVRRADVIGRYGGEEFVVVFFNSPPEDALQKLEEIRQGFSQIFHAYDEGVFSVTFSAGLAHFPAYPSMMELMTAADSALYTSKRNGRNRVTLADRSVVH